MTVRHLVAVMCAACLLGSLLTTACSAHGSERVWGQWQNSLDLPEDVEIIDRAKMFEQMGAGMPDLEEGENP